MAQPYVGEIRMFAGNFAPAGWAFCNGALMPISENETLWGLLGTTYGGNGTTTFGLPDLQGRLPMHQGQGSGISQNYTLALAGGVESVALTTNQIPSHNHSMVCSTNIATLASPSGAVLGQSTLAQMYYGDTSDTALASTSISSIGGSQPHTNFQPYLCVSFIISLYGLYPSQ